MGKIALQQKKFPARNLSKRYKYNLSKLSVHRINLSSNKEKLSVPQKRITVIFFEKL